jgi:osmotically-inducible protein OsmY
MFGDTVYIKGILMSILFTKKLLIAVSISGLLSAPVALAGETNSWKNEAQDAWIDGKAEATLLFNGNLDSFDINTDVESGVVTLTGKVDNSIEKELASELVMGISGVTNVVNELTVINEVNKDSAAATAYTDAKIVTVITSRYLFNSQVSGLAIDVDVEDRVVTLNGEVSSEEEKDLAINIAKNASDVREVKSNLIVTNA